MDKSAKGNIIHCVQSIILICLILNLTTGCYYYRVNTKLNPSPEDIRWEGFNGKYMILHYGDSAWHINDISVDTTALSCYTSILPQNHMYYLKTRPENANRFNKRKMEANVLEEVHLYTSGPVEHDNDMVSVDFSSLSKMEIYYYDRKTTSATFIITAISIPLLITTAITIIIALTKSSCPYVYIMENGTYRFVGEIYSGAIYASLERDDYLPLPGFKADNGKYTVKISNELPEYQYINQVELWTVSHPENTEVLADRYGVIHTFQSPCAPLSAISAGNADVAGLLAAQDQQLFLFDEEPSLTGNNKARNSVEMVFDIPAGVDTGKLVIKAKNSYWGDYVLGEFTKYFGNKYPEWVKKQRKAPPEKPIGWKKDQSLPLMIYLETAEGWQFMDYFDLTGPLAFRKMVMPIDLTGCVKNRGDSISQARIKIETGFMLWELDYAVMDFSPDIPVGITKIGALSAINEEGKDMKKSIASDDKKYYTQPVPGKELILDFENPPEELVLTRSVFLHTKGYYEHIRNFANPPQREKLEAFRQPGRISEFSLELFLEAKNNSSMNPNRDSR